MRDSNPLRHSPNPLKPSQTLSKSLSNSLKTSQTQAKSSILAGLGWIHCGYLHDGFGHRQVNPKKLKKKLQIFKKPSPSPQISLARVSGSAVLASRSSPVAPPSILSARAISKPVKPKAQAMEFVGMEIDHSDSHHESWWICESEEFWRTLASASLSLILVPVVNLTMCIRHCLVGFKVALTYMYACAILYHPKSLHDII